MEREELEQIKRFCVLTFVEIRHLRKQLEEAGTIPQDDVTDYLQSLESYFEDLSQKHRNLKENHPHVWK